MRLVNTIMGRCVIVSLLLLCLYPTTGWTQLNSPYSRYGIGNLSPQGNLANRALGGLAAGAADPAAINSVNPASYGNLVYTTLDLGLEYNALKLHSNSPLQSFKSKNAIFSYFSLAFPLLSGNEKAQKNRVNWAMSLGLKPVSMINYKIGEARRISTDSIRNVFEGDGGVDKAYIGTALRIKGLSIGANTGYLFARKNYSSTIEFVNDTVAYTKGDYTTATHFGGVFLDLGVQYGFKIKKGYLRLGAYSNLKTKYPGNIDETVRTFYYDEFEDKVTIDSIFEKGKEKGNVTLPATYGVGFTYENPHWLVGVDYEQTQWDDYLFFGQKDATANSWVTKAGFQYFPAKENSTSLLSFMKYRVGFSFGQDYIRLDRKSKLPIYTISAGFSLPMRLNRSFYDRQFSMMNVTFEYGNRGNSNNNITEKTFRVGVGFSLSDVWFFRQKYQ